MQVSDLNSSVSQQITLTSCPPFYQDRENKC